MSHDVKKYLGHILDSINEMEMFVKDIKKFSDFNNDVKLVRAVEREFEIIGEASNRIKKIRPDIEITNLQSIINLRNRVIHAYDSIDNSVLWAIILKHLPKLKIEVIELLNQLENK
jgi:uncharacterized protein with HEPN domain